MGSIADEVDLRCPFKGACFGRGDNGKCRILISVDFKGKPCSFQKKYKNKPKDWKEGDDEYAVK